VGFFVVCFWGFLGGGFFFLVVGCELAFGCCGVFCGEGFVCLFVGVVWVFWVGGGVVWFFFSGGCVCVFFVFLGVLFLGGLWGFFFFSFLCFFGLGVAPCGFVGVCAG